MTRRSCAILLGSIALLTAVPLIYRGFITSDSLLYAKGIEEILKRGLGHIGGEFNGTISPAYYALLSLSAKLLGNVLPLSSLMNGLSALTSVILQCLLFFLFVRLTGELRVSFFACLAVLLAPTVWLHSHFGHSVLLALSSFVGALIVFDRLLTNTFSAARRASHWTLFCILASLAALFRLDIVLAFFAFFGLLYYRKAFRRRTALRTFGVLTIAGLIVVLVHWLAFGRMTLPGAGTAVIHFSTRLKPRSVVRDIVKNLMLLAFASNVLMIVLAAAGWIKIRFRSPLSLLVGSWILPWAVFLPFAGMDFGRIGIPMIPPLMLPAVLFVDSLARKAKTVALASMLVLAQLTSVSLYGPVQEFYSFKTRIEGRIVATIPLGSLLADHWYRQRMMQKSNFVADQITQERNGPVLIISHMGIALYRYWLYHNRTIVAQDRVVGNGVACDRYETPENEFYVVDPNENPDVENPVGKIITKFNADKAKVHMAPFSADHPVPFDTLFLDESEIAKYVVEAGEAGEKN